MCVRACVRERMCVCVWKERRLTMLCALGQSDHDQFVHKVSTTFVGFLTGSWTCVRLLLWFVVDVVVVVGGGEGGWREREGVRKNETHDTHTWRERERETHTLTHTYTYIHTYTDRQHVQSLSLLLLCRFLSLSLSLSLSPSLPPSPISYFVEMSGWSVEEGVLKFELLESIRVVGVFRVYLVV